jgi:peptidoglycan hydrolase-like protein with peptidoglycan-binding domain
MDRTLVLTTPHLKGDDVKSAQQLLAKHKFYDGEIDSEFGPISAQASYRAQYWFGYATPKQAFGSSLRRLLAGEAQPSPEAKKRIAERKKSSKGLRERALKEMEQFVGLCEDPPGSNNVPEINGWWGGGNVAWCARAVTKAYVLAGSKAFVKSRRYEYVPTIVGDARAGRNNLTITLDPKPGDLVCFDWDGSNFAGGDNHIGLFAAGTPSRFTTVEGNFGGKCDRFDRTSKSAPRIVFIHVGG